MDLPRVLIIVYRQSSASRTLSSKNARSAIFASNCTGDSYLFGTVKKPPQTCEDRPFEHFRDNVDKSVSSLGVRGRHNPDSLGIFVRF
jgi:hypothetical protein